MGWVPGFEYDVFLSYARVDNATADGNPAQEWVTHFHRHLEIALSKKAGRLGAISIWRDSRAIVGNGLFDQMIEQAIQNSAVFVALVSNGFLISEYCSRELRAFFAKAQTDGGLVVGDRYRIFNVQINQIPPPRWPPEFGRTSGFTFHDAQEDKGEAEPTDASSDLFRLQMRQLVAAIYDTLARIREHRANSGATSQTSASLSSLLATSGANQDRVAKQDTALRVFISYSHDSPAQEKRVLEFANRLRADGIDASIDQYEQTPAEGWPLWVEKQMQAADFILIVCTDKYRRLLEGSDRPKAGLGALWEGSLLYQHLYNAGSLNARFIPVVFDRAATESIPVPFRGSTWYRLDDDAGYVNLFRRLTSQPSVLKSQPRLVSEPTTTLEAGTSPPTPLRVFLCHSSRDKAAVRLLYRRLLSAGIAPWLDEENLVPGQLWEAEIRNAVRASDVVLICLSRDSVTKEGYAQKEIRFALDVADEKPEGTSYLIPLRLEECQVPERLRRWQWVDFFAEGGYDKLVKALMLRGAASPALPQFPASRDIRASNSTRVFVSYARADESYFRALERHLTLLQHQRVIESWSVRVVEEYRADEVDEHLERAGLILLLVSPEYLAAEYCYSVEMQRAMERHQLREVRVIPIIVRPSAWSLTPLSDLRSLPTGNLAISEWPSRDAAFLNITREIGQAAQQSGQWPEPPGSETIVPPRSPSA